MNENTDNQVTVYSKPSCVQCTATYRALDSKGIDYKVVDLSEDDNALDAVKALGYLQAPVVVTGSDHWSAYRVERAVRSSTSLQTSAIARSRNSGG